MATAFQVQAEPLGDCQRETVAALEMNRTRAVHPGRFEWLYRANPDGEAVVWTIRDANTGTMAGFTVALPRRVLVDGVLKQCWNCADFSIHQAYRSLGVALKLRRAAKQGVDAGCVEFLYAHPNERMQVIHEKVGHQRVGTMVRMAKKLRSREFFADRFASSAVTNLASEVVDRLLPYTNREWRHTTSCSTRFERQPRFDDRFDKLFADAAKVRRVVGVRDARYLNWRYAENPLHQHHAIFAEDVGRLRGYCIFRVNDGVCHLVDLFPVTRRAVTRDLLWRLIRHARQTGLSSISTVALEGHPAEPILREFGFRQRPDTSSMFCYATPTNKLRGMVQSSDSWFLSVGDRDV